MSDSLKEYLLNRNAECMTLHVLTDDDWYPTFPGNLVYVKVMRLYPSCDVRTCVWGGDDFGMDRDEPFTEGLIEKRMTEALLWKTSGVYLNKDYLVSIGFLPA